MRIRTRLAVAIALSGTCLHASCNDDITAPSASAPPSELLPVITEVTPTTVVAGEIVTISGSNFGNDLAAVTVMFGTRTGEVLSVTPTRISVRVPITVSGNLQVTVSIGGRTAVGPTLTVLNNPVITGVTPTTVVAGEIVTISGSNFGNDLAAVTVTFGTRTGEVLSVTPTSISARVPNNVSGNLQVAVSIGGRTAVGPTLTVILNNPVITGVTPTTVVAGEIVTISVSNFGNDRAAVIVRFGTSTGEVLSVTPTSISVRVPISVSGNLQVTVSIGDLMAVGPTLTVIRRVAGSFNVSASVGNGPCGPIDLFDLEGIANSFEGPWSIQQVGAQLIVMHGTRSWTGVLSGNMFEAKTNPPGLGSGGLQLAFSSIGFTGIFTLAFGSTCQNTINLAGIRASFN